MRSISRVPATWMTEPAPRKSSALKSAWFRTCSSAPVMPSRIRMLVAGCLADQGHPDPHEDDADIFDAVICQQPFKIMLPMAKATPTTPEMTPGRAGEPPTRAAVWKNESVRISPYIPTLIRSRHGRRDVTGSVGVGRREPDMKRHDAGFHAEGKQGSQENCCRNRCCPATGTAGRKGVAAILRDH